MPRTKKKPKPRPEPTPQAPLTGNGEAVEILTLAEAAAYLRLPEAEVIRLVHAQDLPGRFTGTEWRFCKSAIRDWLSKPLPRPSKEALLSMAGAFKDDPDLEAIVEEAYRRRGRSITEDE
jgi:excisionase family DNA binding protein